MRQRNLNRPIRLAALLLVLLLAASFLPPLAAQAQGGEKVVRVGWHEEPYFITDQYGRRSGYSYEYQCKVAAYTGWTYEYVEGSWTELLQKLKDGELDLLSELDAAVLLVIVILLLRSIRAEKKILEEEHLVNDLNRRVFVDALTSVRNKGAFANYVQELQGRIDRGEELRFAVGVFDCDNLKTVNDQFGHDKGDVYLKAASRMICQVFQHSPVFRIGGDEFAAILQNGDYEDREELIRSFEERRKAQCTEAGNRWEEVHVSMGVAVYDPLIDHSVIDTVRRADKIMYADKRERKRKA